MITLRPVWPPKHKTTGHFPVGGVVPFILRVGLLRKEMKLSVSTAVNAIRCSKDGFCLRTML